MLSPRFSRFSARRARTHVWTGATLADDKNRIAERPAHPPRLFKNAARLRQFLHRIRPETLCPRRFRSVLTRYAPLLLPRAAFFGTFVLATCRRCSYRDYRFCARWRVKRSFITYQLSVSRRSSPFFSPRVPSAIFKARSSLPSEKYRVT